MIGDYPWVFIVINIDILVVRLVPVGTCLRTPLKVLGYLQRSDKRSQIGRRTRAPSGKLSPLLGVVPQVLGGNCFGARSLTAFGSAL